MSVHSTELEIIENSELEKALTVIDQLSDMSDLETNKQATETCESCGNSSHPDGLKETCQGCGDPNHRNNTSQTQTETDLESTQTGINSARCNHRSNLHNVFLVSNSPDAAALEQALEEMM